MSNEMKSDQKLPPRSPVVLNTSAAAVYLGVGKSTLEKLRLYGDGPRFIKYARSVRYLDVDLDAWRDRHRIWNTSELDGA